MRPRTTLEVTHDGFIARFGFVWSARLQLALVLFANVVVLPPLFLLGIDLVYSSPVVIGLLIAFLIASDRWEPMSKLARWELQCTRGQLRIRFAGLRGTPIDPASLVARVQTQRSLTNFDDAACILILETRMRTWRLDARHWSTPELEAFVELLRSLRHDDPDGNLPPVPEALRHLQRRTAEG